MRKINKNKNSEIIRQKLKYKNNNSENNKKIRIILEKEQGFYCAYTEELMSAPGYSTDIDHFNPNLKNTDADNYFNWFAISHSWNIRKSKKWKEPILHPTSNDFEERILYDELTHLYYCKPNDIEANNLIDLLNINDFGLTGARDKYINNLLQKKEINKWTISEMTQNESPFEYSRAVETVFDIKIN